jgi:hypothetical protein
MNDLDINNYSMEDILQLFKISNFDEIEMKRAKKMVLMIHPDKSHLSAEYFYFYTKAYKILYSMYEFKNKMKPEQSTDYVEYKGEEAVKLNLDKMENFTEWFNEEFEKRREESEGYDEWLKSNNGIISENVQLAEMNQFFEERAVTIKTEVKEYYGNSNENFEPDVFSSFQYSDLKEAHTLAPVSMDEYYNKPKYNIDEYKKYRQTEEITNIPYDEKRSAAILAEKNKADEEESIARAYYYAKKTQEAVKANEIFLAKMKLIK